MLLVYPTKSLIFLFFLRLLHYFRLQRNINVLCGGELPILFRIRQPVGHSDELECPEWFQIISIPDCVRTHTWSTEQPKQYVWKVGLLRELLQTLSIVLIEFFSRYIWISYTAISVWVYICCFADMVSVRELSMARRFFSGF